MNKQAIKRICAWLSCLLLLSGLGLWGFAQEPGEGVSGAVLLSSKELTTLAGGKTGVIHTQLKLPSGTLHNPSGRDKLINLAEFDLANTHLSVEAINCGKYLVSTQTVKKAVEGYHATAEGGQVLAAMNGDLWMTSVNSNSGITKSLLQVSRGVMITDGEIWASQEIGMENASATNGSAGTETVPKAAFGVTRENQPLVGTPWISVTVTNETTQQAMEADGINRLPANDSVIIYNHRCYTTNYALNDAYEVELETDQAAFSFGGSVVARVKAIYPAGSTSRPAIGEGTVLITARGSSVEEVAARFSVGDVVSFRCDVTDTFGNDALWREAVEVIGGHILLRAEDQTYTTMSGSTEYPVSLIGIRDDGHVLFCTVTAAQDGVRLGVNYATLGTFVEELGYNSVFFLDGGGSATFVVLEEGSYTVRSGSSDGSPRAVINAVAVVWNDEPICQAQGSIDYIRVKADLSEIPGYHIPADLMEQVTGLPNACEVLYREQTDSFEVRVTKRTNDPYVSLDYTCLGSVDAETYPYIVLKLKTNLGADSLLSLYHYTGSATGAAAGRFRSVSVSGDGAWRYYVVDMSADPAWRGRINGIRLDVFDSMETNEGAIFSFGGITLCRSQEEAALVASGNYLPEGAVGSYREHIGLLPPSTAEPPATEPTTPEQPLPQPPAEELAQLAAIPGYYLAADLLPLLARSQSNAQCAFDEGSGAYEIKGISEGASSVYFDLTPLREVRAADYRYLVLKLKLEPNAAALGIYPVAGEERLLEEPSASLTVLGNGKWAYYVATMTDTNGWYGLLQGMKLELTAANGGNVALTCSVGCVMLCRTLEEAQRAVTGQYIPAGAVESYREFLKGESQSTTTAQNTTEAAEDVPLTGDGGIPTAEQPNVQTSSGGCGAKLSSVTVVLAIIFAAFAAATIKRKASADERVGGSIGKRG